MKKLSQHPYSVTSIVFLILLLVGRYLFNWRDESYYGFLLLLYFIVTLGIRLDDIAKQIGSSHNRPSIVSDDEENIMNQLSEIRLLLISIDKTLKKNTPESSSKKGDESDLFPEFGEDKI